MLKNFPHVELFLSRIKLDNIILSKRLYKEFNSENVQSQLLLAEQMLVWAKDILGSKYLEMLSKGYVAFSSEVNKAQARYEIEKSYQYDSFEEVSNITYHSKEFMELYHWGVYSTTFLWKHHFLLYEFYKKYFISNLKHKSPGTIYDFGTGSGIWLTLSLNSLPSWKGEGIDISPTSSKWAKQLSIAAKTNERTTIHVQNALNFRPPTLAQAAMSCFLLEHLEYPNKLLQTIYDSVEEGATVFITAAITAAEIDHIYEFKTESELVNLCEQSGFRVIATFSASPSDFPSNRIYLPRSMALIITKKKSVFW
ncbi:MAG: methyltransferase domain-containing protein [Flavobacteriales bacterium]|nr:MAG: methyltransferase domain-containing protein [Flavobacteriales bacterium]